RVRLGAGGGVDAAVSRRPRSLLPPPARVIRAVSLARDAIDVGRYPYSIPAMRELTTLELNPHVTLFAGENGSGKSTLIEAIAIAAGFNAEGGSRNMSMSTRASHSELHEALNLVREPRPICYG